MVEARGRRLRLAHWLARLVGGPQALAAVTARVDDGAGWSRLAGGGLTAYDRDSAEAQELYADTLAAWRNFAHARRAVDLTTDFVVGDGLTPSSRFAPLDDFIRRFWHHPHNRMDLRLAEMCDELTRAGDLFVLLFRNRADGMSYVRFIPKDRITAIETAANDWEVETVYHEQLDVAGEARRWYGPQSGMSRRTNAIMLHYAINRPIGALTGESDLSTVVRWFARYDRMLADRVRLHWAVRSFLWFVQVPSHRVLEKAEQYRRPPEAGSIVVHDDAESWQVQAPSLHASDAAADLEAIRRHLYAGAGAPPHWFGEPGSNLAEARAMQMPAERHLKRRQDFFAFMVRDIIAHAYRRAAEIAPLPELPAEPLAELIAVDRPAISRADAADVAGAAADVARAYAALAQALPAHSPTLASRFLALIFRVAGFPLPADMLAAIEAEAFAEQATAIHPLQAVGRGGMMHDG